jgi:hypothetical protein
VVREDPKKRGLLFAGSEREVYVSFDDGDHWQSLQLNMASSSVRDITVKDDDLIAATHGRGFWILDDVTPLRQIDASTTAADAVLFKPTPAYRVRWNTNTDTPLPPDEPAGLNPPEGAIINYYLKGAASGPVTLEVIDAQQRVVRRYSSADPVVRPDPVRGNLPLYWFRPPMMLSTAPGMHRFTWDVHYQPLPGGGGGRGAAALPIAAVPYNTVAAPTAPWVRPGSYTVKLTVNGRSYTQPIAVKQDPRVKTPAATMERVYGLTESAYMSAVELQKAAEDAQAVDARLAAELTAAAAGLTGVMNSLQAADAQPTALQVKTITTAQDNARTALAKWRALRRGAPAPPSGPAGRSGRGARAPR